VKWLVVVGLLAARDAGANAGGFAGASGKPGSSSCIDCHGGGGDKGTVELKGPATLGTGETGSFSIIITSASPMKQKHAGVDVAASAGTLKVRPGGNATKILNGEIVHEKTAGPADPIEFQFDYTAPQVGGKVTLFGAGLSADGDGKSSGDSMKTAMLEVQVVPPDLAGVDFSGIEFDLMPPPEPDLTAPADLMPVVVKPDEPRWGCGCRAGERSGGAWAAALVALGLLVRRRRATV
jgi:MYXO-CTERM domain-containing protein